MQSSNDDTKTADIDIIPPSSSIYDPTSRVSKRDEIKKQIEEVSRKGESTTIDRYIMSCLSAIPVVGGAIGGVAGVWSEQEQNKINDLFISWMKLQEDEIKEIGQTLFEIIIRLDKDNPEAKRRIESPEYLGLIKKAFRNWSAAESEEKRVLVRNLLSNAGAATQLVTDDVLKMFIDWIDEYSEAHFKVIRTIYNNSGITRREIWLRIHGEIKREDSAEADLFKLLINDLSQGHVIRQHRETDYYGNFIRQSTSRRGNSSGQYTSAFDDEKQYELTELGMQFVHYTMNEVVPKLSAGSA